MEKQWIVNKKELEGSTQDSQREREGERVTGREREGGEVERETKSDRPTNAATKHGTESSTEIESKKTKSSAWKKRIIQMQK